MANEVSDSAPLRVVLVGTAAPLGSEVKVRLEAGSRSFGEVVLAELEPLDSEGARLLGDYDGEALLIVDAQEVNYADFDLAVLLGSSEEMSQVLDLACQARACLDASGASRERPDAFWAHTGTQELEVIPTHGLLAAPHPVAFSLAQLLHPLTAAGLLRHASASVLLPAAALGAKAVEELHQQTLAVLSFQEPPKEHLRDQLAFNTLPLGAGAGNPGHRIAKEISAVLGEGAAPCDVQLLLVPSYNGYGFSLHVSLTEELTCDTLRKRLASEGVRLAQQSATPRQALEHNEILVGPVEAASSRAHWIWAVADSLGAGAAENVVGLVDHLAGDLTVKQEVTA